MSIIAGLSALVAVTSVISNVLAIFGKKKAQKKAKQIEQVAAAVITGVETFTRAAPSVSNTPLKTLIQNQAIAAGVENVLKPLVKKYTD